ncbi:hypothetical protein MFU01_47110 [Myxococcus fulvus]|uniref:Uncharacterized protein n=1 Tax=Myxococcus fulvus TaxID=33 RepID=A0A511T681_MYXFU|nr:hypothetical protein MFU01_47110 [Myxococcus fulvus]
MSRTRTAIAILGSFLLGILSSVIARDFILDWWYGPAQFVVLDEDIELSDGHRQGMTCPGPPGGGVLAGTPLVVRAHGAKKLVELRFTYYGKDLPSTIDAADAPANRRRTRCVNPWEQSTPE